MRQPEEWRTYPKNERYEVSSHGRIRAVAFMDYRANGVVRKVPARMLCQQATHKGHRWVHMYQGCVGRLVYVHRAVLETFVGPPPDGRPCGLHSNRDPADNYIGNLRWGSQAENMEDKVLHGMQHRGERTPSSKLKEPEVMAILADKRDCLRIALDYGVSKSHVHRIKTGKSWKHLTGDLNGPALEADARLVCVPGLPAWVEGAGVAFGAAARKGTPVRVLEAAGTLSGKDAKA